jgi:hypothetical protein
MLSLLVFDRFRDRLPRSSTSHVRLTPGPQNAFELALPQVLAEPGHNPGKAVALLRDLPG